MKKITAFLVCLMMLVNLAVLPASAHSNEYPYIFIHGMGGWGSEDPTYADSPYWGSMFSPNNTDLIKILNENGIEAYAPSMGAFSSAWDRACELYAQLMGTVVDYGAVHSKTHKHDRYGNSYENRAIMGEPWDMQGKINLVGYSFGGETARLFTSLLAYGNKEELAETGNATSELFKGGYDDVIHSCITLASPHNGTQLANYIFEAKPVFMALSVVLNYFGITYGDDFLFSLQLGHYGIGPKQDEEKASFSLSGIYRFYKYNDNCAYDMTLAGARELNEKIKLSPNTYYYSYSVATTKKGVVLDKQLPIINTFSILFITSPLISLSEGKIIDGIKMEGDWLVNDGVVPLASAIYPLSDAETAKNYEATIAAGEVIEPGRWYYFNTIYGMDHVDLADITDYPTTFEDFYLDMIELVNSR